MISSSKWSSALPCCQPSLLSFLGLLMSLATCAMALVISSADQTGQQLVEVSQAFQSSLSGHGMNGPRASRNTAQLLSFREAELDPRRILRNASGRFPRGTVHPTLTDNAASTVWDVEKPAWVHFLGELERFCRVSSVDVIDGETAIDLLLPSETTDQEVGNRTCDLIQLFESRAFEKQSGEFPYEYQLIIWAGSPGRSAFLKAALRAANIESHVRQHYASLLLAPPRLSSSGQVWSDRRSNRPAVTVVIRRPIASH